MAPRPLFSVLGVPQEFLNRAIPVAEREGGISSLASMLNRFHNPSYGSNWQNWLNPSQYEVLQHGLPRGAGASLQSRLQTPTGLQELMSRGQQLKGVTDFRATKYLRDTGNLLNYPDNLIPTIQDGQRVFMTPAQLRSSGLKPDVSENTFFNERPRPATTRWWEWLGPRSELDTGADSSLVSSTSVKKALADDIANQFLNEMIDKQGGMRGMGLLDLATNNQGISALI